MKNAMIMGLGTVLLLAGCGGGSRSLETAPPRVAGSVSDYPTKLGEPYVLDGVTYTPVDVFNYDETGFASWYGQELSGRSTANGEVFDPNGISGAHRTLPLPSYVEVTALDTGKTILVRLNDRGPASRSRLIDLSYGAARQLGVVEKGSFAVRVRRVNPPEAERARLRAGQGVALRMDTPESLLVPLRGRLGSKSPPPVNTAAAVPPPVAPPTARASTRPDTRPTKPPISAPGKAGATTSRSPENGRNQGGDRFIVEGRGVGPALAQTGTSAPGQTANPSSIPAGPVGAQASYYVQVGAFSSKASANTLARRIGARVQQSSGGDIYRVRYGPYPSEQSAQQGLTLAQRNGYQDARILQDQDR